MRNSIMVALVAILLSVFNNLSHATDLQAHHHTADHVHFGNEPIGVMGAHAHGQGDWMFSYRAMRMDMEGNRDGTDRMSRAAVFNEGFMIAPTRMTMDMHMLGAMYGVSDDLTVMLMLPYLDVEMDHVTAMGAKFTTRSNGLGDVSLGGLYTLGQWGVHQLNLNAGLSIPTGSIDEKDDTPAGVNQHLPYPMQLGSGTYDLLPGVTYLGEAADLSWGAQALAVIRLGENDNDYTLGDRYRLTGWLAQTWTPDWNTSLRFDAQWWDDIDGRDSKLPAMLATVVPTAAPGLRAGRRLDLLAGVSLTPRTGVFRGHRFEVEYGRPVYQHLDGPQLETDWMATLGWQALF